MSDDGYKAPASGKLIAIFILLALLGAVGAFALNAMEESSKPKQPANTETTVEFGEAVPLR